MSADDEALVRETDKGARTQEHDAVQRILMTLRISRDSGRTWGQVMEVRENENLLNPDNPGGFPPCVCPRCTTRVVQDVELALRLAFVRPTGDAADALRERLRGYIRAYAGAAEARVRRLGDGRERDIAAGTVAHARAVAADPVHDPAANLRLLAMGARMLVRYASGGAGGGR